MNSPDMSAAAVTRRLRRAAEVLRFCRALRGADRRPLKEKSTREHLKSASTENLP